jgi:small subunit ribosomal protein S20
VPKLKSSQKRLRTNLKARLRNKAIRSTMRTSIKKVRLAEDPEAAQQLLRDAVSVIDKTVKKGGIRKNTGSRYKSRLTQFVAKIA